MGENKRTKKNNYKTNETKKTAEGNNNGGGYG